MAPVHKLLKPSKGVHAVSSQSCLWGEEGGTGNNHLLLNLVLVIQEGLVCKHSVICVLNFCTFCILVKFLMLKNIKG